MKLRTGLDVAVAVILSSSSTALAADTRYLASTSTASSTEQVPGGVTTIKAKTAGTSTNFSGTYRYSEGSQLVLSQA